jgi:hypothetical protein
MHNIRVRGEAWYHETWMHKYGESIFDSKPEVIMPPKKEATMEDRLTEFYRKHNPSMSIPVVMDNLRVLGEQWLYDLQMEKYKESVFEKRPESSTGTTDHILEYRLRKFYDKHNPAKIPEIPAMIKGIREYGERHYHMEMMKKYGASIFDYPETLNDSKETTSTIETLEERLIATPVTTMVRHAMNTLKIGFIIAMNFILFMISVRYLYFAYTLGMFGRAACFLNPSCPLSTALGT